MDRVMRMLKTKYATFTGRARRKEYWYFVLFYLIVMAAAAVVDAILFPGRDPGDPGLVQGLVALALICPSLAVSFRRLHDIDRTAWWLLLGLIPILGGLWLIYWFAQPGTKGPNRFGPDPLEEDEAVPAAA